MTNQVVEQSKQSSQVDEQPNQAIEQSNQVIEKLYQAFGAFECEAKEARDYGTGDLLTYAEITVLGCVRRHEGANASELSACMGITNGAVTQFTKKLIGKGYVEAYRIDGNRKDIHFRLTENGEIACRGYDARFREVARAIRAYVITLDGQTRQSMIGLFDVITQTVSLSDQCALKHTNDDPAGKGKCQKCQTTY